MKKLFSFVLCIIMVVCALPIAVISADTNNYIGEIMVSCNSNSEQAAKDLTNAGYTIVKKQGTNTIVDFNEGAPLEQRAFHRR